jgi:hypothetical protein
MFIKNIKLPGYLIVLLAIISCERAPEFSEVPTIGFESVKFGYNPFGQDSLIITINFEDGDGDLGITSEEAKSPPFHDATYFTATSPPEEIYNVDGISSDKLLRIGDSDTLPRFSCLNYRIFGRMVDDVPVLDTVYIQPNPKSKNFLVEFFIKQDDDTFKEFDFLEETCIPSSGRFAPLNTADHDRPLQGTLSYFFRAQNLRQFFGNNTIKMRLQIIDKGEHFSNVVESHEFTLDEILIID